MPSSSTPERDACGEARIDAERLCGCRVTAVTPVGGGGNNRLYRVDTAGGRFALKCYGPADARGDRLGREFDGLRFLREAGLEEIPTAVAVDRGRRVALYGWVEGVPADGWSMDQAVAFIRRLHHAGAARGPAWQGLAAEACLSARELIRQVRERHARLATLEGEPALGEFLDSGVAPLIDAAAERLARLYAAAGLDEDAELAAGLRILSPSDFGFHNAVRQPDGRLVFVDFEYFGWDDPVKLVADVVWHPGMGLDGDAATAWLAAAVGVFDRDAAFTTRLSAQAPLFGLRWCLIVLNEFLPERWRRRVYANGAADRERAKAAQLAKARSLLERTKAMMVSAADAGSPDSLPTSLLSTRWSPSWTTDRATSGGW